MKKVWNNIKKIWNSCFSISKCSIKKTIKETGVVTKIIIKAISSVIGFFMFLVLLGGLLIAASVMSFFYIPAIEESVSKIPKPAYNM